METKAWRGSDKIKEEIAREKGTGIRQVSSEKESRLQAEMESRVNRKKDRIGKKDDY